ncbi:MAG: glycosyltransferase [Blastocatellia bacterium]|nr:glycosyltransferase [Blastocatellia bacterium]
MKDIRRVQEQRNGAEGFVHDEGFGEKDEKEASSFHPSSFILHPSKGPCTERPRVLHLINSFEIGGTERQAVELLKRLDTERYDVRLAALSLRGPLYREIADRFPQVPVFPLNSFYNLNALRQLRRLRELMIGERIDILHAHDFYAGFIGATAARLAGVRVVACQRHLKLSDRAVHVWGTRIIHASAHRILVNSEAIRDYILAQRSALAPKIVVIKNGVRVGQHPFNSPTVETLPYGRATEEDRFALRERLCRELGFNPDAKIIGMVARLQPVKGHRFFIEAAAQLIETEPKARFVLVGDGPLRSEIEAQAAELGLNGRLAMLGDRDDASRLVAAFDLFALSSLHEGLPNAVMEAMAAGVPVIATAVGGTRELIADGETGYLVPPADSNALRERMRFALANEENRRSVADNGRRFIIERFGMQRMVESVERLYDELMESVARP